MWQGIGFLTFFLVDYGTGFFYCFDLDICAFGIRRQKESNRRENALGVFCFFVFVLFLSSFGRDAFFLLYIVAQRGLGEMPINLVCLNSIQEPSNRNLYVCKTVSNKTVAWRAALAIRDAGICHETTLPVTKVLASRIARMAGS